MNYTLHPARWATCALLIPGLLLPLGAQQPNSLRIASKSGSARVVHVHGRSYVDVEDLARLLNASMHFTGSEIQFTFSTDATLPAAQTAFSKGFVTASIEAIAEQREWRAALKYATEGGYPLTEAWLSTFRAKAQQALQLASVNASTASDLSAASLLTTQFNNMSILSDKYLQMTRSMSYIDPSSLNKDSLDQKIMACSHALSSIATAKEFIDDGACH